MGFDCRTSTGLGKTDSTLRGHTQDWPCRRLNQTHLLVLEGLLQRRGVALSHCEDKDTGSRSSGKYSLVTALPESAISPTKELGRLQCWVTSGQTTNRREPSLTHQQTTRLKFYWALPTTSPSHQEACTSLLDSLIYQRADSRSKKNYNPAACGMKTTFTERHTKGKGRGLCTTWRKKIKPQKNN